MMTMDFYLDKLSYCYVINPHTSPYHLEKATDILWVKYRPCVVVRIPSTQVPLQVHCVGGRRSTLSVFSLTKKAMD